ncbi:hypothetical protein GQ44DRAFT_698921 [Phaeosphaeriaceae sp. PMI808]|nr:hypothetical protein GQ44DRAFT_698921 [Phaeosphaeriaceae sp. PMI808]
MDSDLVLPSSPPHVTTEDIDSSPFFDRCYHDTSPKSSSPPPLFSSDDSCESADLANYESPRIFKNKRKGAWWDNSESAHNTPISKKTKMTRNYDSGVYMMSDSASSSESLLLQRKLPFGLDGACDESAHDSLLQEEEEETVARKITEAEEEFCKILDLRLHENSQKYYFGGINLEDGDIRRIGEITSVIGNIPDPGNELPAEGQYRSMLPEVYIDLRFNRLVRLTPSLFNLSSLTTLILNANRIEELPAQIGQLHNLQELHISSNPLRWLPFEFLECYRRRGKVAKLILGDSGVDWLEPKIKQRYVGYCMEDTDTQQWDAMWRTNSLRMYSEPSSTTFGSHSVIAKSSNREQFIWYMRAMELDYQRKVKRPEDYDGGVFFPHHPAILYHEDACYPPPPRYMSRTQASYFDQCGVPIKNSPPSPCVKPCDYEVITETSRGAHGVPSSWFTPPTTHDMTSLATMSLHAALRQKEQDGLSTRDMRRYIGEPVPRIADAILEQADYNAGPGFSEFKKCHMCRKDYVIPRAEWVEWWLVNEIAIYPFRVQMCSWGCVPEKMIHRPEREMVWEA